MAKWYSWGANSHGQLGLGDEEDRLIPTELPHTNSVDQKVVQIFGGGGHSLSLSIDGSLHSFGWNNNGQLGIGNESECVEKSVEMNEIKEVKAKMNGIALGWSHSGIVDENGDVKMWGNNQYGQLGVKERKEGEKKMSKLAKMRSKGSLNYRLPTSLPLQGIKIKSIACGLR
eukprot:TRINITY_DN6721_c0_g1_i1.p1 TRINITY_DN6721_c0_g1~~TRINITY_DN6721_c0_g1_i1.p1  ORF type:complete len:172 (-),score=46.46 TRINITY_DN6721_c0_g1_i1:586-1101(-)